MYYGFLFVLGLGLALKLGGVARIELNYCVPVKVIILNTFNSTLDTFTKVFSGLWILIHLLRNWIQPFFSMRMRIRI